MRRRFFIVPVLAPLFLLACGDPEPADTTLAVVNGAPILLSEYQDGYRDYLFSGGLQDEPVRRSAYLNRMIAVELIVAEARDAGVEQTDEFRSARDRARQKLLIEAYLANEVYAALEVTQDDLLDMFVRVNTQMTARHLFAPSRSQADALYRRVVEGESFSALAREVFADPVLADNGGLVGTFGFDEMDPAFEETAFRATVGEVSPPVQTAQGFSIIKVEDRFTKPVITESEFVERRAQLEGYVLERKQLESRRAFLETLVADAQVSIDPDRAERLLAQIAGQAVQDDSEAETATFVTFAVDGGKREWSIDDFRAAAEHTTDRQRRSVDNQDDLEAFVEGLVVRAILLERAESQGLARDERVRKGLDGASSDWIYEQAFGDLVSRMELSEVDLRAYYDNYPEDFTLEPRVRISEIVTASRRQADSLKAALDGASFASLARKHSLRPSSAASGGDLGYYTREELGPWGDNVFGAYPGTVVGPLASAGRYLLLSVDRFEDARQASFDEVRPQVEAILRRERQQEFLRDHVQDLRRRYPVEIVIGSLEDLPLSGTAHV